MRAGDDGARIEARQARFGAGDFDIRRAAQKPQDFRIDRRHGFAFQAEEQRHASDFPVAREGQIARTDARACAFETRKCACGAEKFGIVADGFAVPVKTSSAFGLWRAAVFAECKRCDSRNGGQRRRERVVRRRQFRELRAQGRGLRRLGQGLRQRDGRIGRVERHVEDDDRRARRS